MLTPDDALENLTNIYTECADFCAKSGQVSEADTRAKIIDRILKEGLGWSEENIRREGAVNRGYFDYGLIHNQRYMFIVEAKREGLPFDVPKSMFVKRKYRLAGSIKTSDQIKEAIEQVQHYCVEVGCRYAVATNGYAWIIFRALREDSPWRKGDCIVFASAGEIKKHFVDFWNLLSKEAVLTGSLDETFSKDLLRPRNFYRPTQYLHNPDAPLTRNSYHTQLNPFVENIFRDIGSEGQLEILSECYVYGRSLRVVDTDLRMVIEDSIPRFLKHDGGEETKPATASDAGVMGKEVGTVLHKDYGTLFLLLGGIGSGKTTYIKRYFNFIGKPYLDQNAFCFYVDLLAPPASVKDAENYLFSSVLSQLRQTYSGLNLESRERLLRIYNDKIILLKETYSQKIIKATDEFDRVLSAKLQTWTTDANDYVGRLLRSTRDFNKTCVLCIDNVDQLPPEYQAAVFLIGQRAARDLAAVVIIALREESYYAASIRNTFTAYNNRKFHIASPNFTDLVRARLKYCRKVLNLPSDKIMLKLRSGAGFDKARLSSFLDIVEFSIFTKNKNIARFIEALSFGNMREALDMFSTFMLSGTTNVDKMLKIYERDGKYFVAFHEFAKSIILGDRRYYKDSVSKVLNIFDCSQHRNGSHLTSLRLLSLLLAYHNSSSVEGRGFISLNDVIDAFVDIFDNELDVKHAMLRLLDKQLIQVDTRSTKSLENASYVRITSAGWYYFKYLVRSFAYLDLVFQDTPFDDEAIARKLRDSIVDLDRYADTQDTLSYRMHIRFGRVEQFLSYLLAEENKEYDIYSLSLVSGMLNQKMMPSIVEQYEKEKQWIQKRVSENLDSKEDADMPIDALISDLVEDDAETQRDIDAQTELEL